MTTAAEALAWLEGPCGECGFDASAVRVDELPAAVLAIGRRYHAPLTRGLPGEALDDLLRAHPFPDTWSGLEYACHVRDVLAVFDERTHRMLDEDDPALGWWDHDGAVEADHYNDADPEAIADAITAGAAAYAATLESVSGSQWDRWGQRADIPFTVKTKAQFALHEANHHLLDLGRVIRAPLAVGSVGSMSGPDVSKLSPSDCIAALRSYPRRYRAIAAPVGGDEKPDDLVHRAGPDGRSALDHVDHVARSTAMLGQALHQVLVQDKPVLPATVLGDDAREWAVRGGELDAAAVLDFLSRECEDLAASVGRVGADDWTRTGTIAGSGATITAIDVVREAVRTGAVHLHAAEAAVEAARRTS